jgi:hypothetical protein
MGPTRVIGSGAIRSENYVAGSAGWSIDGDGNVEFASGNFRGDITGATGTFSGAVSGATISGGSIDIGGVDATSFHVDSGGNMWLGAATYATAPFRISSDGVLVVEETNGELTLSADEGLVFPVSTGLTSPIDLAGLTWRTNDTTPAYDIANIVAYYDSLFFNRLEITVNDLGPGIAGYLYLSGDNVYISDGLTVSYTSAYSNLVASDSTFRAHSQTTMDFLTGSSFPYTTVLDLLSAWTSFTPTWGISLGGNSLGNGTLDGKYFRIGKLCHVHARLTIGSTTSFGSGGFFLFTMPFTMLTTFPTGGARRVGDFSIFDASTSNVGMGYVRQYDSTRVVMEYPQTSMMTSYQVVTNTAPMTWATGDVLDLWLTIELA